MASEEWLSIYRTYEASELTAEITRLKALAANPYSAQAQGNRSYQRSTTEVRDRLQAALQVQTERGRTSDPTATGPLEPDFSQIQV